MSGKVKVDGKTARACDGCVRKRARWYCAADDAFLCQNCDASVHSANPLARKHQRVRLKVASNVKDAETEEDVKNVSVPSWHHGFRRKPRSPRKPAGPQKPSPGPTVPELGSEETSQEENYEENEQLLYRVPIYDPFGAAADLMVAPKDAAACDAESREVKALLAGFGQDFDNMDGIILPSDVDLAEFAADVESLLGGEQDYGGKLVKVEDGDAYVECQGGGADDVAGEGFEVGFGDYDDCPMMTCWEEETKNVSVGVNIMGDGKDCERGGEFEENKKRKILLNLDYESVVLAWPSQRSPWTTGLRPEFDATEECWPDCMGGCGTEMSHQHRHVYGEIGGRVMSQQAKGGREARVTRYREKRRTRLFSKKIRYEVRKLNAEKRPRMKGRFVKRASLFGIGPATTDENL